MRKEEKSILIAIIILVAVIATVAVIGELTLGKSDNIIQGEAEATLFRVSSKVPGRIEKILVREGDTVEAGDTVAILEAPDVTAKLVQVKAIEEAAEALNEKVEQGARPQQKMAAYEMWQKAVAGVNIYKKTYERIKKLYEQGVVAAQKLDEAEAEYKAAQATARAAKAEYELAMAGAEIEDKAMASAKVRQAQGAVEEVDSYVNETYLIAVQNGEISDIFPSTGELVGAGAPIINIAYLDEMWISFNIREDYLKNYNIGERTIAYIPALDTKCEVEIYYMKDLGTYAVWRATKASGEYDIKTFEVRARPLAKIVGLRPGMSVLIDKEK